MFFNVSLKNLDLVGKKPRFPSPKIQYGNGRLEFQKPDMATEPIW